MKDDSKEENITFKILLVGDSEVGKTSFILRFCEDTFKEDSLATIGLDTKTKFLKRNDKKIQLIIWDTAGQERFKSLAKNIFKGAQGILLMYSIDKKSSFKAIKDWLNSIKERTDIKKVGLLIIGNKCDLPEEKREVDQEMVDTFKEKEKIDIIEGSAKNNINVNEAFISLIDKMLQLGLGKKKKSFGNDNDDEGDNENGIKLNNDKKKKNGNCCGNKK